MSDAIHNLAVAVDGVAGMTSAAAEGTADLELQAALMDAANRLRDVAGEIEAAIKAAEEEQRA